MTGPWTNPPDPTVIIVGGSGTFTGVFVYDGTPGAGNLIASVTNANGTDPFGNAYLKGITSYGTDGSYTQIAEFGASVINLQPSNEPGADFVPGEIDAISFTGPGSGQTAEVVVTAPTDNNIVGDQAATLVVTNRGTGTQCRAELDGDLVELNGIVEYNNAVEASSVQTDSGTVTSTTYTPTRTGSANTVGAGFFTPPSGKVKLFWQCGVSNSSTTAFTLISFEVRTGGLVGSGTVVFAANDNVTIQHSGTTAEESKNAFYPLDAGQLSANTQYNVRLMYRVSAGTGTINRPRLMVEPIPG
jgi:hypothetical protein